jgi:hypothetical protein
MITRNCLFGRQKTTRRQHFELPPLSIQSKLSSNRFKEAASVSQNKKILLNKTSFVSSSKIIPALLVTKQSNEKPTANKVAFAGNGYWYSRK